MWPNEKASQPDPTQGTLPDSKDARKDPLPNYSTENTFASSSTAFQTRFASLSMHMEDRIRLLKFPTPIIDLCRRAIKATWARGIQDEREYGGSHEFKLYGTPWRGYGEQAIAARRLIKDLLAVLHTQGWVLMLSTDVSKKNYDKDSLLFRHQTPAPAECDWCCISFSKSDRIRFIDAPSEVYNGFIPRMEPGRLQDQGQHALGVYELKIYGKPWWAGGIETMMVRGLLLSLLESLEEEGWTVYASIDQKNGGEKYTETDTWHCCRPKGWEKGAPVYHN
ncbi:hypothetical protein BDV96DRAFT_563993 [Lophiotrema nucula]|uniref:Uncharacterized protein n=1 Tax=Lophiotrema nucula TaxID=690887 RepID=A0A6A5ZSN4_9PLEO|nr:hypothetical protein BDV96DRAFT_563993 [Lophiotrema nucula]